MAAILNRSSPTSGDVVMIRSAMVENVGVSVGIMYVGYVAGNRSYIDQQKIFDFSMEGAFVFPGRFR